MTESQKGQTQILIPPRGLPIADATMSTHSHDQRESQSSKTPSDIDLPRLFSPAKEYGKDYKLVSTEHEWCTNMGALGTLFGDTRPRWTHLPCPGTPEDPCLYCTHEPPQSGDVNMEVGDPPHGDTLIVAVDGYCTGKIGRNAKMAIGVFFAQDSHYNKSKEWPWAYNRWGKASSQRAELGAHLEALVTLVELKPEEQKLKEMKAKKLEMEVLEEVKAIGRIVIKSNSAYAIRGLTKYIQKWKVNRYRNQQGQIVVNEDMFRRLEAEVTKLENLQVQIQFWLVKEDQNEEADELAKAGLH